MGEGVKEDYEEACKWFQLAAEQGHAEAQNSLGECYYNGEGVEKNRETALKWCQLAAEQGNASAEDNLRTCFPDDGVGEIR